MFLLLTPMVLALDGEHLLSIGDEVTYDQAGAWARVFPAQEPDWHFLFAAGGEFYRLDMTAELEIGQERQAITGRSDLDDHSVSPCPNGGYMMASSAGLTVDNDSGYMYRLDDDFNVVSYVVIAESDPEITYNDMGLVCGEDGAVSSFANFEEFELVLMRLEDSGAVRSSVSLGNMPTATGGSLLTDPRTGDVLFVGIQGTSRMTVVRFSWDLELLGKETIYEVDDMANTVIYWPQAAMALEDRYLVSYVRQDAADGFVQDWGHIHLAVFDLDWNLLEDHRITDAPAPDGSMRPGLAVRDDTLIVSYDRIVGSPGLVQPRLRTVMLALDAFEDPETPGDSGLSDSGTGSDTATEDTAVPTDSSVPEDTQDPGPGDSGGDGSRCGGCQDSTSPAPPAAAVFLFALFPFRRRTGASWRPWSGR